MAPGEHRRAADGEIQLGDGPFVSNPSRESRSPSVPLSGNASDGYDARPKPGYSRVVYCNDPGGAEAEALRYPNNAISTTKFTAANFIPKALFEQFRRVANLFFLVVGVVSLTPLAPFRSVSVLLPLVVVVGASMAKEGMEDWQRKKQDILINIRKVKVYDMFKALQPTEWKNLRVGDIVNVDKDDFFPADLLLLSSSSDDGVCYVETMNLDGETNLKRKRCLEERSILQGYCSLQNFKATVMCEDPNANLYSFIGTLHHEGLQHPISPHQILLRGSKLRNTQYILGVVIFTGHDTKVMQNAMDPPSKRSNIERRMDKVIYVLFSILVIISGVGSIFFGIATKEDLKTESLNLKRWYLRPDKSTIFFDPRRAFTAASFHFLTCFLLYGSLIPISLYITIEIVKVLQSNFINQDRAMYCEESNKPARARTSNLNEELGQVNTIMSDKTGTLTSNSMVFLKCSVAGISYGIEPRDMEFVKKSNDSSVESFYSTPTSKIQMNSEVPRNSVQESCFRDDRLMEGHWVKEVHCDLIQKFFHALAICHTAIPDVDDKSKEISYEAEYPDEAALLLAARQVGFEFYERTPKHISLYEYVHNNEEKIARSYELLDILEFNSSRKRMSVIVKNEEGQLLLFCKGADSVIFDKLSQDGQRFVDETRSHISMYSEAGLRTLVVAYCELSESEYKAWHKQFTIAKNVLGADRDAIVDATTEKIERNLILLGATAVEDRLQKGVPECINKLAQAGIKIWILTGDKLETAVNISFSCNLLRKGMKQIVITLNERGIDTFANESKVKSLEEDHHESIAKQLTEAQYQLSLAKKSYTPCALIIEGDSLAFALSKSLENLFLDIAIDCASVICCRTSPKQKALVTRLVKKYTKKTTLAIGDGANDVGMLHEADIGVGISGTEGMQAVMASDFAIAQFRFLERLLLVHGHWCYRRLASMICYFFYKNMTFALTLFWFEAHASFSGQPAYNDMFIALYGIGFTSFPLMALGAFDQDISAQLCLKFPLLHQDGVKNTYFSWPRILGWMLNGISSSVIVFYSSIGLLLKHAFDIDGHIVGLEVTGMIMFSAVVWIVNCQLALYVSYFTGFQHLAIWGSIILCYIFFIVYGLLPPSLSTTAFQVFLEECALTPLYWMASFFIVITALLPYLAYSTFQAGLFPRYYDIIKREENVNKDP